MMAEVDIYGVFVPGLLVFAVVAVAATAVLQRLLDLVGFYRIVWHRSLFDLALFVVMLGAVFVFFEGYSQTSVPVLSTLNDAFKS